MCLKVEKGENEKVNGERSGMCNRSKLEGEMGKGLEKETRSAYEIESGKLCEKWKKTAHIIEEFKFKVGFVENSFS